MIRHSQMGKIPVRHNNIISRTMSSLLILVITVEHNMLTKVLGIYTLKADNYTISVLPACDKMITLSKCARQFIYIRKMCLNDFIMQSIYSLLLLRHKHGQRL